MSLYELLAGRQLLKSMAAIAALGLVGAHLGACASIHLASFSDAAPPAVEPGAVTSSVNPSGSLGFAGSDRSDWDLIRETAAASLASPASARIEWANQATGDSGTISDIAATRKGGDCRSFATTISAVDGVRLYHAEICKSVVSTWEFSKVDPADGVPSVKAPL